MDTETAKPKVDRRKTTSKANAKKAGEEKIVKTRKKKVKAENEDSIAEFENAVKMSGITKKKIGKNQDEIFLSESCGSSSGEEIIVAKKKNLPRAKPSKNQEEIQLALSELKVQNEAMNQRLEELTMLKKDKIAKLKNPPLKVEILKDNPKKKFIHL